MKVFLLFFVFSLLFVEAQASQADTPPFLLAQVEEDRDIIKLIREHKTMREDKPDPDESLSSQDRSVSYPEKKSVTLSPAENNGKRAKKPYDPKAKKMAQCLSDIQNVLNARMKRKLIQSDPSAKGYIECYNPSYTPTAGIWNTGYPTKGYCYDRRNEEDQLAGMGYFADPDIPEAQKDEKLKQCLNHLKQVKMGKNPEPPFDPLAKQMAQCLSDTEQALENIERGKLAAKGSKLINILCAVGIYPANSSIWYGAEPKPFCYDITNKNLKALSSPGKMKQARKPISQEEKYKKLSECENRLAGIRYPKAKKMAQCLNDIRSVLNARMKRKLIKSDPSAKGYIECDNPSYTPSAEIWHKEFPAKGSCYDRRKAQYLLGMMGNSVAPDIPESKKDERLKQCQKYLAVQKSKLNGSSEGQR